MEHVIIQKAELGNQFSIHVLYKKIPCFSCIHYLWCQHICFVFFCFVFNLEKILLGTYLLKRTIISLLFQNRETLVLLQQSLMWCLYFFASLNFFWLNSLFFRSCYCKKYRESQIKRCYLCYIWECEHEHIVLRKIKKRGFSNFG